MIEDMSGPRRLAIAMGIVMAASTLSGCISGDGGGGGGGIGGVKWERPTQVRVEGVVPNETTGLVGLNLRLYDGSSHVTRWDVQLRVMAHDSKGFEMLNISLPIKARDFTTRTVDNVVDTWYNTSVPFAAFKKSSDKTPGFLTRMMTLYAWITYEGTTYRQSPDPMLVNMAIIPSALLLPNIGPTAALYGPMAAWEGEEVPFDASNSTDDGGSDALSFAWDWGDGTGGGLFPGAHESHRYTSHGVYQVNVTVTDAEGASAAASAVVTVEDPLQVAAYQSGVVASDGEHHLDTYVAMKLQNIGPAAIGLAGFSPVLRGADGTEVRDNGSEEEVPQVLQVATTVSVVFYFDTPEGFDPAFVVYGDNLYPVA